MAWIEYLEQKIMSKEVILLFDHIQRQLDQFRNMSYLDARVRLDDSDQILFQQLIIQQLQMEVDDHVLLQF